MTVQVPDQSLCSYVEREREREREREGEREGVRERGREGEGGGGRRERAISECIHIMLSIDQRKSKLGCWNGKMIFELPPA